MSINQDAKRLVSLMKNHASNEVKNNALQSIHRQGYIKEILGNNLYVVVINEEDYKIEAREGLTLILNDIVIVMLYNGDISRPWIIDKKPKNWK